MPKHVSKVCRVSALCNLIYDRTRLRVKPVSPALVPMMMLADVGSLFQ